MEEQKVELFIPGDLKDEPIIYSMIKDFNVFVKIVEASFSTESGWAYLVLRAEKKELEKMYDFLREKGVSIEVRNE
ncbi:MAG: NIL domain-containing protein [Candidatus Omnitrophota bacterium]|jgi:ABC-type methionine transport system ATPase subunit